MSEQPALPLDTDALPITPRDAYESCPGLKRCMTYEQAMSVPAIAICLKDTAEEMAKRRRKQH